MKYQVRITAPAERDLERLDRATLQRVQARIDELSLSPYSPRISKALKMFHGERSSRVGDWRIIYQVSETENIIEVLSIFHRGKAYK